MNWFDIKSSVRPHAESSIHPHVKEECAEIFRSTGIEETEIEYLDLLYGLIRASKPHFTLETGTYKGLSSIAMGFAIKENDIDQSRGDKLYTVENNNDLACFAQYRIEHLGLSEIIEVCCVDSLDFIFSKKGLIKFDFVYFDSRRKYRPCEFHELYSNGLLADNCVLAFHDTSTFREVNTPEHYSAQSSYLLHLEKISELCHSKMIFELSRGLTVFRLQKSGR